MTSASFTARIGFDNGRRWDTAYYDSVTFPPLLFCNIEYAVFEYGKFLAFEPLIKYSGKTYYESQAAN
jgi:hypothetical protein